MITALSRQLDPRHPANWKLLTMLAAVNNATIGLLYQHRVTECGSTVTKVRQQIGESDVSSRLKE